MTLEADFPEIIARLLLSSWNVRRTASNLLTHVDIQALAGTPALPESWFKAGKGRSALSRWVLKDEQWKRVPPLLPG